MATRVVLQCCMSQLQKKMSRVGNGMLLMKETDIKSAAHLQTCVCVPRGSGKGAGDTADIESAEVAC